MIECNPLNGGNGRNRDGVLIFTRFSKAYVHRETGEIVLELPEGASEADYGKTQGLLRQDQTDKLYQTAHDIEGTPYTYTEVFPTPESYCEKIFRMISEGNYTCTFNTNVYPEYKSNATYSEGDIVTHDRCEWISTMNDNTGNPPTDLWGWDMYLPYIEERDVQYASVDELANM